MKFFIFSIDRSAILIDQDSRAKALRLVEGRGCFIVTVSVISKRRISSRNAYIRGEEKCRRSGWHRGCSFGAATARNIKSLPATTLNREIIQSVSRGFGHSREGKERGAVPNPLFPSVTYSLSYSTVTQRGSFCFNPFANELSIKFYHATEIKEERGTRKRRVSLIYTPAAVLHPRLFLYRES